MKTKQKKNFSFEIDKEASSRLSYEGQFDLMLEELNPLNQIKNSKKPPEKIALYKGHLIENPETTLRNKWAKEMEKARSRSLPKSRPDSLEKRRDEIANLIERGKKLEFSEKNFKFQPNIRQKNKMRINFFFGKKRASNSLQKTA